MKEEYSQLSNEALRRAYVAAKEKEDAQNADYVNAGKEIGELEKALEQARQRQDQIAQEMYCYPESDEIMEEIQSRLDDGRISGFA